MPHTALIPFVFCADPEYAWWKVSLGLRCSCSPTLIRPTLRDQLGSPYENATDVTVNRTRPAYWPGQPASKSLLCVRLTTPQADASSIIGESTSHRSHGRLLTSSRSSPCCVARRFGAQLLPCIRRFAFSR